MTLGRVLYCHCAHTALTPDDKRKPVLDALTRTSLDVLAVPDLCGLAATRDGRLKDWFAAGPVLVIACYARTIHWLLRWAGVWFDPTRTHVVNLRADAPEAALDALPDRNEAVRRVLPDLALEPEWIPWFPVLDGDRCTNCRQCLSFCPFGVYEMKDGRVTVCNPTHCKNNCPACARICPKLAIVFPKLTDAPLNGAPVTEQDVTRLREAKARLEGETDIHALLARRRMRAAAGRFARNLDAAIGEPRAGGSS
jgi:NAD-dependent dihydropyrimidine dehydrogenase PreA subunit